MIKEKNKEKNKDNDNYKEKKSGEFKTEDGYPVMIEINLTESEEKYFFTERYDNLNTNLESANQDKERMLNEIDKYKAHIMFLTETNQKLINELEAISERDHQIKMILSQGEDIPDILNKTRSEIDNALNNLEIGLTIPK